MTKVSKAQDEEITVEREKETSGPFPNKQRAITERNPHCQGGLRENVGSSLQLHWEREQVSWRLGSHFQLHKCFKKKRRCVDIDLLGGEWEAKRLGVSRVCFIGSESLRHLLQRTLVSCGGNDLETRALRRPHLGITHGAWCRFWPLASVLTSHPDEDQEYEIT